MKKSQLFLLSLLCIAALCSAESLSARQRTGITVNREKGEAATAWTWDADFSLSFLFFSYAAYCPHPQLQGWNCTWCRESKTQNFQLLSFFSSKDGGFGYVGSINNTIVVSFQGSSSLLNWIVDLESAELVPYPNVTGAEVGKGFYTEWNEVSSQVISAVANLHKKFPTAPIYVTGHSLGAAESELCALSLVQSGFKNVNVINFGCPRVGNQNFSDYYISMVPNTFRVVNGADIVPHLPPTALGFHHNPTEVWEAPADQDHFKVCSTTNGEDPLCSDSQIDLSVADHLHYFGYLEDDCANFQYFGV